MQHDRLQGPAIDGRGATSATIRRARSSLYCMAANAALGACVPDVESALDLPNPNGRSVTNADQAAQSLAMVRRSEPHRLLESERADPAG
jgi:hypothetical protein